LIRPHHLAPVFGVELAGQHGRVHQVTKQHRELAALGLNGTRFSGWGFGGDRSIALGRRPLDRLGSWQGRRWGAAHVTGSDPYVAVLVHGDPLGLDELLL
jgi:hypothetical protein